MGRVEGMFRSVKLLHETVIVDVCHLICHLSKLKECTAQRVNLYVKLWTFVNDNVSTMTYQL